MKALEAEAARIEMVLRHIDGILKEVAPAEEVLEEIKAVYVSPTRTSHSP